MIKNEIYRFTGKRNDLCYTMKTVKFMGKSLMLWGCIQNDDSRELAQIDGSLNNAKYIQLLKDHLIPNLDEGE